MVSAIRDRLCTEHPSDHHKTVGAISTITEPKLPVLPRRDSQWSVEFPFDVSPMRVRSGQQPLTQGHEFTGFIHSVGELPESPSADPQIDLVEGLRVVCPFTTSCGECWFCTRNMTGRCTKGSLIGCPKLEGAQAGYVRVPLAQSTLFEAPQGMEDGHLILMAGMSSSNSLPNITLSPSVRFALRKLQTYSLPAALW